MLRSLPKGSQTLGPPTPCTESEQGMNRSLELEPLDLQAPNPRASVYHPPAS